MPIPSSALASIRAGEHESDAIKLSWPVAPLSPRIAEAKASLMQDDQVSNLQETRLGLDIFDIANSTDAEWAAKIGTASAALRSRQVSEVDSMPDVRFAETASGTSF
ncbi:unnamed protein product [Effrenium voratum]|nr:unnamed protein product [Effrenium voratum]